MNYKCNNCLEQFKPNSQFDTNCTRCGSDDVAISESKWNGGKIAEFFTKKPNRYFFIGLVILMLLLKLCSPGPGSENVEYSLEMSQHDDFVQFSIRQIIKDDDGNKISEKPKITGKAVEDFLGGIFRIDDSGKTIRLNLIDGDKYYACSIPEHAFTFMLDPKRVYKISKRSVKWLPTKINCPLEPQEKPTLTSVTVKQTGGRIEIATNLDNMPNHEPYFYSITGKNGEYSEGKSVWDICDLSEIEVWVTDEVDTVLAAGPVPYVVDKSACPMNPLQLRKLVESIQNSGNNLGANMTDANLLSNFENSFSVMVDSDGDGTADKRIGATPMNISFVIDDQLLTYMGFQGFTLGLNPPIKKYRCSVVLVNSKISKVVFN